MDKQTRDHIKKHIQHYQFHAFHYVDWDDLLRYDLIQMDQESLFVYGYRHDHHIHELLWAVHDVQRLIAFSMRYPKTLLSFIPRAWKDDLQQAGLIEYGIIRDYWLTDLSSYQASLDLPRLTLDDAKMISEVTQDCLMASREFHGESKEDVQAWLLGTDFHLVSIQARDNAIFGYQINHDIVGVVFVAIYGDRSEKGPVLWLREIAVKRDFQGRGIGQKLMKHALYYGNQHGAKRSFLAADDLNVGAIHLYTSLGYRPHLDDEQIDFMTP